MAAMHTKQTPTGIDAEDAEPQSFRPNRPGEPSAAQAAADTAEAITAGAAADVVIEATGLAASVLDAAVAAASEAAERANQAAAEIAAQAAAISEAMVQAASAAATVAQARGRPGAADRVPAVAPIEEPLVDTGRNAEVLPRRVADSCDPPVESEFETVPADPVLPWFPADVLGRAGPPADQALWRDIALARRLEASLRSSEAHFEAVFDSAPTPLLIAERVAGGPGRFVAVNPALARLTGYAPGDLLEFSFLDLEHREQRSVEAAVVTSGGPGTELDEQVRRWTHADGRELRVRIRMAVTQTAGYHGDHLICQIEDVTARLDVEAAVRDSEARFSLAFATAPQPMVLVDLAAEHLGRLFATNRAAEELFDRSPSDLRWLDYQSLTHPADRPAIRTLLEQLSRGELSHYSGEHRYLAGDGGVGWLALSAEVVDGAAGRPGHVVAQLWNTTDLRAALPVATATARTGIQNASPAAPRAEHREAVRAALGGLLVEQPPAGPPGREPGGLPKADSFQLRVLLVEDAPVIQRVAAAMLRNLGHHVQIVDNGQQAVEAVQASPYDVVFMDIQMPVMDGLEATRRIRAGLPRQHQPRIVAMTGAVPVGSRDVCVDAGMDDYLAKPVRQVDMRRVMTRPTPMPAASAGTQK
jgi:PAS domain S-box-containing protein